MKVTTTKFYDKGIDDEVPEWDGAWDILADGQLVGRALQDTSYTYPVWHGFVINPETAETVKIAWTGRKSDIVALAKKWYA